jgi:tight adherence protein C
MITLLFILLSLTLFCGLSLALSLLLPSKAPGVFERLLEVTRSAEAPAVVASRAEKLEQVATAAATWLRAHFGLRDHAGLQQRFARAGLKGRVPADIYLSIRILGPLAALLLVSLLPAHLFLGRWFWMMTVPAVLYLLPDLVLERMVRRRRERIRRSIPDVIDLLVICVDAGLGLDQAILRVGQELSISHPEINDEFLHLNREQRAGRPRAEAWSGVADRVKLPDIDAFVSMLLQTERFGTPISKALSAFAGGVRTRRRQAAEEQAAKTTIKIIFPLVFFIFPAIFVVLLGPAALKILHGMGSGF